MTDPTRSLLDIRNLSVTFAKGTEEQSTVVDDVSFSISPGRTLGIVGESGSGKSVTSLAIMGLLGDGVAVGGSAEFDGTDLLQQSPAAWRDVRGNRIAMIFQEPMTSLNPAYTVGMQISESLIRHKDLDKDQARARAIDLLKLVRIPSPERRYDDYPHKLSGGMRQRVMIAMALACEPQLLIADEPTTALDVTVQAQILYLIGKLREETGAAIALITHDLGVVAQVCDDVVVMYAGQVVEQAPVEDLFAFPRHPYTVGLLGSLPKFGERKTRLPVVEGSMPAPGARSGGCRFADRCPFRIEKCDTPPPLVKLSETRTSRCWRTPLETLAS